MFKLKVAATTWGNFCEETKMTEKYLINRFMISLKWLPCLQVRSYNFLAGTQRHFELSHFLYIIPKNFRISNMERLTFHFKWECQKQPLEVFYKKKLFFCFIPRKSLFLIELTAFIKKRLQRRLFSVKIAKILRTPILKNICVWLLL